MDEVDAVEHLGACGAGTCLRDAEELLVLHLGVRYDIDGGFIHIIELGLRNLTYNFFIDPANLVNKFVVKLGGDVLLI